MLINSNSSIGTFSARKARSYTWCDQRLARVNMEVREPERKIVILHVRLYFFIFLTVTTDIDRFFTCHNVASFQTSFKIRSYNKHHYVLPCVHPLTERAFAQVLKDRSNID